MCYDACLQAIGYILLLACFPGNSELKNTDLYVNTVDSSNIDNISIHSKDITKIKFSELLSKLDSLLADIYDVVQNIILNNVNGKVVISTMRLGIIPISDSDMLQLKLMYAVGKN